jgi:acyl carrier protein
MPGNSMQIRSTVLSTCQDVAKEQRIELAPLADSLLLTESGLDSLCLAVIVARLEDSLGFDPFDTEGDVDFPVTLGDFIRFYENAAAAVGA